MSLKVLITSREEKIFDGTCQSVSSSNDVGEFDVLKGHANFISLIQDYVILDKGEENEIKTNILNGVLRCVEDNIDIYVQISEVQD